MKSNLRIIPQDWLSWDFRVLEGGVELAVIDKPWLRERGTITIDGKTYTFARTSVLRGTFTLEHDGKVLAEAVKPSHPAAIRYSRSLNGPLATPIVEPR